MHNGPTKLERQCTIQSDSAGLAFRRLSIVDLVHGHQPMANEDGKVQVAFNGEIYNHVPLRRELEAKGHTFATDHSDTEVIVHGWEEWGYFLASAGEFEVTAIMASRSRSHGCGAVRLSNPCEC